MNDSEVIALPNLNVASPITIEKPPLVQASSENLGKICEEILTDVRTDGNKIDSMLTNFLDMVTNEGDASSSTKEAVVNLIKIKSDLADKKVKVLDLLMRAYLKETNTFPKYLTANQNNKITIQGGMRDLVGEIKKEREV